jgi:hypothetical protein
MGISQVHKTASVLAERLNADQIDYAIAGALALNAHGVQRMTEDVDVLISRKDLRRFKKHWLGRGYIEVRPGGKSIRDAETNVRIDFLIAGDFPGDGRPKPVSFPDPKTSRVQGDRFSVLSLPMLIELKIASGMTAKDRPGDLQDVIRLVRARSLPRDFQKQLDPYVRGKFLELWEAAQAASEDY